MLKDLYTNIDQFKKLRIIAILYVKFVICDVNKKLISCDKKLIYLIHRI